MTLDATPSPKNGSRKARLSAARLAAVQAVYQILLNEQAAEETVAEFIAHRFDESVDGQEMVTPDETLFRQIVLNVEAQREKLSGAITEASGGETSELLLQAILLCGTCELAGHGDVDAPVVINDYLHVTEAFYAGGEKKLVNGVLDGVLRIVHGK